jgi:hypothetical protein
VNKQDQQKWFDQALAHMRKQGKRSMAEESGDMCLYRAPDGGKCAIGALIPDELYQVEGMEGMGVLSILSFDEYANRKKNPLPDEIRAKLRAHFGVEDGDDIIFLSCMQRDLHDSLPPSDVLGTLEWNALVFAEGFNLTYTPPAAA